MATENPSFSSQSPNVDEKDIPQTQPSAPSNATSALTATAPSYSPIYATAQSSEMTGLSNPANLADNPSMTTAPPQISSSSTSPPPPQPGAVPLFHKTPESSPQRVQQHQQQDQTQFHPPPPAPAPKTSVEPTPAPAPVSVLQPQSPSSTDPPIITTPPTFRPAPSPATQTQTTTGNINPNPNRKPTPRATASYSYQPGAGYNYPSSYSYSPSPSQTQPLPQVQPLNPQQPQLPNSTTTPYTSIYSPPSASAAGSASLPFHNTGTEPNSEEGLWGSAKSWLQSTGNKLAEVEAEVWRRINEAHDK
ncbi:hypothetical protein BDW62DRAFT_196712 [Aspergillus aurantiobrunneus]